MILAKHLVPFEQGQHNCVVLMQALELAKDEFQRSLIPDLSHIDVMAHNQNGIVIQSVTYLGGDEYLLEYSYDWEVFNGCIDVHETGIERNKTKFSLSEQGRIEFDLNAFQDRDTLEEF